MAEVNSQKAVQPLMLDTPYQFSPPSVVTPPENFKLSADSVTAFCAVSPTCLLLGTTLGNLIELDAALNILKYLVVFEDHAEQITSFAMDDKQVYVGSNKGVLYQKHGEKLALVLESNSEIIDI